MGFQVASLWLDGDSVLVNTVDRYGGVQSMSLPESNPFHITDRPLVVLVRGERGTHMHARMHTHTHTHARTDTPTHAHTHPHACSHARTHAHIHAGNHALPQVTALPRSRSYAIFDSPLLKLSTLSPAILLRCIKAALRGSR